MSWRLDESELAEAKDLLSYAVAQPFVASPEVDGGIEEWFDFLAERLPLATLQTEAYLNLGEGPLPSTEPLGTILRSILQDEGWKGWRAPWILPGGSRAPLERNLNARREGLGRGAIFGSCLAYREEEKGQWRVLLNGNPLTLEEPPRNAGIPGTDPPHSPTPYEEVGRELVWRIQLLNAARDPQDRAAAKDELEKFLGELGGGLPAHGPELDVPRATLVELFSQIRALLDILWTPISLEISDQTREILADNGAEEGRYGEWGLRLALPVLSQPELMAAIHERESASTWSSHLKRPTARRLAVWMLARRLGSSPERIANKVGAGSDWDYFKHSPNPIDSYVTPP